jgi:hypothetical protein
MENCEEMDEIKLYEQIIGDGKELAASLDKGGYNVVADIKRKIEGHNKNFDEKDLDVKYAPIVLENLMHDTIVLRNKNKKSYSEFLDSLANMFIGLKRPASYDFKERNTTPEQLYFQEKTHSLCHLFEGYPKRVSFFDEPVDKKIIQKLVDESAKEAIEVQHLGCMDRILAPLMGYNLDNLDLDKLDNKEGFVIQINEKYRDNLLQVIESDEYGEDVNGRYLLSSKTPRELITNLIKKGKYFDKLISKPEQEVNLLNAVKENVTAKEMNKYFKGENTLENLTKDVYLSKNAAGLVKGIYVDVDGTLINCNQHGQEDYLNEELADYLIRQKQKGKNVVIFSGGSPEKQTKRLEKVKVSDSLLPVASKDKYKGKILEVLIDDTKPEYQGFKANNYINPEEIDQYDSIEFKGVK